MDVRPEELEELIEELLELEEEDEHSVRDVEVFK